MRALGDPAEREALAMACLVATGALLAWDRNDKGREGARKEREALARAFCGGLAASAGMPRLLLEEGEEEDAEGDEEDDDGAGVGGARAWWVAVMGAVARGVPEEAGREIEVAGALAAAFPETSFGLEEQDDAVTVPVWAFARAVELAVRGGAADGGLAGVAAREDAGVQAACARALASVGAALVPPEQPFETCENVAAYGGEAEAEALQGAVEAFAGASIGLLGLAEGLVAVLSASGMERAERQQGTATQVLLAAGLHMPLPECAHGRGLAYGGRGVRGWASSESRRAAGAVILALAAKGSGGGGGDVAAPLVPAPGSGPEGKVLEKAARDEVERRLGRVLSSLRPLVQDAGPAAGKGHTAAKWQLLWALGAVGYPALNDHVGELMACVMPVLDAASPLEMSVGCECWALVLAKASLTRLRTLGFAPLVVRSLARRVGGTEEGLLLRAVPALVDTARKLGRADGSREADEVVDMLGQALEDHWSPRVGDKQDVAVAVMDALTELVGFVGLRAARTVGRLLPLATGWPKDARARPRCALAGLALAEALLTQAWPRAPSYAVAIFTDLALCWRMTELRERSAERPDAERVAGEARVKARAVEIAALLSKITGKATAEPVLRDFLSVPVTRPWAAQVLA